MESIATWVPSILRSMTLCSLVLFLGQIMTTKATIETLHPANLHHVPTRESLSDFLHIAANAGQVTVFSYKVRIFSYIKHTYVD